MNYLILGERSVIELQESVNTYIKDGWKPQGGVFVINGVMYQAIIKD